MAERPEQWWGDARIQLLDLLTTLDEHGESLIAAYVALAIDRLDDRVRHIKSGPV